MSTVYSGEISLASLSYLGYNDEILIARSQIWWDSSYSCRRNLTIVAPPDGLPSGHPISAFIPSQVYYQGKVQASFNDLEVLYLSSEIPEVWIKVPRVVEKVSNYFRVRFNLREEISDSEENGNYYIYYSNPFKETSYSTGNPYSTSIDELDWPLSVGYDSENISYTRPGEDWVLGLSSTSNARATLQFYGPQAQILMDKGPNFGIVSVQVDSGEWYNIDLYSAALVQNSIIYTAYQLGDGMHEIRVKVSGSKNPASSSANCQLRGFNYKNHSVATTSNEEHYEGFGWNGIISGT